MADLAPVQVHQPRGHLHEDLHQLWNGDARQGVQGGAVDVLDEQVQLARTKQPIPDRLERINLDKIRVLEELGDLKLMFGLFLELGVRSAADRHDLEGVMLGVGPAADVQDRAVRAGPQRAQDLKLANTTEPCGHTERQKEKVERKKRKPPGPFGVPKTFAFLLFPFTLARCRPTFTMPTWKP